MNACLKTARWLGAALPMLTAMIDVTPARAQSSARELPAVVVDQPSRPPAARSRPAPKRQSASAASRRAAQRAQTAPDAAAAAGARAETGTGPVRGYLANQSGTGTNSVYLAQHGLERWVPSGDRVGCRSHDASERSQWLPPSRQ